MHKKLFYLLFIISISSCYQTKYAATTTTSTLSNISNGGKMWTSAFQQQAAEYKALCAQAYNLARLRINAYVKKSEKPLCIITDIDETILDNSPYAVKRALAGLDYSDESWHQWTARGDADTLNGAADFLKFVSANKITVFYISNRMEDELTSTIKNLNLFNLPNADLTHIILKNKTSSKEERRKLVEKDYEVILLMGDNLADFNADWDRKSKRERTTSVAKNFAAFGDQFIVFPNANYGDWEGALAEKYYGLSAAQKDSVLRHDLKSF